MKKQIDLLVRRILGGPAEIKTVSSSLTDQTASYDDPKLQQYLTPDLTSGVRLQPDNTAEKLQPLNSKAAVSSLQAENIVEKLQPLNSKAAVSSLQAENIVEKLHRSLNSEATSGSNLLSDNTSKLQPQDQKATSGSNLLSDNTSKLQPQDQKATSSSNLLSDNTPKLQPQDQKTTSGSSLLAGVTSKLQPLASKGAAKGEEQLSSDSILPPLDPSQGGEEALPTVKKPAGWSNWEEAIASCQTLEQLKQVLKTASTSPLQQTANSTVFSTGSPQAEMAILGEAPGADEDRLGLPFVGRCGKLLDQALALVGLSRNQNLYITNVVPWRPPENRTPSQQEIAYFLPYLKKHLALTKVNYILLLGAVATSALVNLDSSLGKLRGKDYQVNINGRSITAVVTYHPAYLLRQPQAKKLFWADLIYFRNLASKQKLAKQ